MIQTLKHICQLVWTVSVIVLAVTIGAMYGWQHHGWMGAVALGGVGLTAGTFMAVSPLLLLEFFQ
jgi:hypothetical protein